MLPEILADNGQKFVIAVVVVLLGLLCLALVLWIIRGRPSSPFIRGGRNRTPRLAVLDAAAIDTRRRLVLVRRDDVEHLVMIGGPTDIVIESRIATTVAESAQPAEKPAETTERAEPTRREPAVAAVETPVVTRPVANVTAATVTERRPTAAQDGVSAMGKVLYAGDEDTRSIPARAVPQPIAAVQQTQPSQQQRTPERRVEDLLEQNRQRVLTPQPASTATASSTGTVGPVNVPAQSNQVTQQRPATAATATPVRPEGSAADNPALVSEFEKLLEAEMANNPATAATAGQARTAAQPTLNPTQTAAMAGQAQPAGKSREETEAEMARLLGEIAANRKG
ncbi:flagellar biosynthetic protein FliO [Shinella sedimenti]|uniref:Flagellar biosynthetic protein FliO n=1 Tax=Shinella sedimenti TaxID=2919913 RepID=A0ABT0CKR8_9HYPH|nr:flagellar biosynthetic protein FliO [Shinella sedimenti]MCJ8148854.1 flagellar biosynthetic protein FliO [Shinella sedimenti]